MRKKLLIDEHPIIVQPTIAKIFGLNEAIFLQQLHYWLNNPKAGITIDGIKWIYNTYEEWEKTFQIWSQRTLMRIVKNLQNIPIICVTDHFNKKHKLPLKTNWFTILYSVVELVEKYVSIYHPNGDLSEFHSDNLSPYMVTTCDYAWGQPVTMHTIYCTETTTEIFTETTKAAFDNLILIGFKKSDAKFIIESYPIDYIQDKIKYLYFEINVNNKKIEYKSKWLMKSLQENFTAPKGYEQVEDVRKLVARQFSAGPS